MKKIVVLLLCFALTLGSITVSADNDLSPKTAEALEILQVLGFLNTDYSEEMIDVNAALTRAEFAEVAGSIFNVYDTSSDVLYFHDVPKDYYAYKSITYLTDIGTINGNGNKEFHPDDKISATDAAKIVLYALGYGQLIESSGGYPSGVNSVASRINLYSEVTSINGNLTYAGMFQMLYNAVTSELIEANGKDVFSYNGEYVQKLNYKNNGNTFLSQNYDIYIARGIVKGVDGADFGNVRSRKNQVVINETVLETDGKDYTDFLGHEVKCVYKYDEEHEKYSLIWMKSLDKIDVLELTYFENEPTFDSDNYVISYSTVSGHTTTAPVSKGIKVIYNGHLMSNGGVIKVLGGYYDNIRLFQISDDSRYDLAIVEKYDDILVDLVDAEREIVYDKGSGKSVCFADYTEAYIYNSDGGQIEVSQIPLGAVISVYESYDKDVVKAYVSNTIVTGTLKSVDGDGAYPEIVIEDTNYTCFYNFKPNSSVGCKIKAYIDYKGYVAYITYLTSSERYGYLISTRMDKKLDEDMSVKIFTDEGNVEKFKCNKGITIDGINYRKLYPEGAYNYLGGAYVSPQVIRFSLNSDNEVTMIDTVAEDANSNFRITNQRRTRQYKGGKFIANSNSDSLIIDSSTLIFNVPGDPNNASDEDYNIIAVNKLWDWLDMNCEGYSSVENSLKCEVLLTSDVNIVNGNTTRHLLVDKATRILDNEGNYVTKLEGYYGSSAYSVTTEAGYQPENIKRGDVIYVTYNNKNKVTDVSLKYRIGETLPAFIYDHSNDYNFFGAYAYDTNDGILGVVKTPDGTAVEDVYKIGTVWIYYSDADMIEKGTWKDIVGSRLTGNGDPVVIRTAQGYVSTVYVFK